MYAFKGRIYPKYVNFRSIILQCTLLLGVATASEVDLRFRIYVPEQGGILTESTVWNALPELFLKNEMGFRRLSVARGQASGYFKYAGKAEMTLYTREVRDERLVVESEDPAGLGPLRQRSSYKPYAKVVFPVGLKEAMVMIRPEKREAGGLRSAIAMNIDPTRLPKGKGTFYNASSDPLTMLIAGNRHVIRPGGRLVLRRSEIEEKEVGDMAVGRMVLARRDEERGNWEPKYNRPVYLKPDVSNFFLISSSGNGRYRVRVIYGEEES